MKSILKNMLYVSLLITGLSFTSCKGKTEDTEAESTEVTDTTGSVTATPVADTVVKKNGDTIVDMKDATDASQNTTGTQVP